MSRASALLCSSTLPAQYATLVAGYLAPDGEVELANAGHPPPLILTAGEPAHVVATGLPAGMFCDSAYGTTRLALREGDTLLLYSDGLSETPDRAGVDYGTARLLDVASQSAGLSAVELISAIVDDHAPLPRPAGERDDFTLLAIRRQEGAVERRHPGNLTAHSDGKR